MTELDEASSASQIVDLGKNIGIELTDHDIQSVKILLSRLHGCMKATVKFKNFDLKKKFILNKHKLSKNGNNIFINEKLTKYNGYLFKKAREAVKNGDILQAVVRGGKIKIKLKEESSLMTVYSLINLQDAISNK